MDAGFDKNKTKLGVFVFAVPLEMLADSDGLIVLSVTCFPAGGEGIEIECYLLDQHVEVLGYFWSEACHGEITPSVKDQAEAMLHCMCAIGLRRKLFHTGCTVPLDLRMRRILLPGGTCQLSALPLATSAKGDLPVTTLT